MQHSSPGLSSAQGWSVVQPRYLNVRSTVLYWLRLLVKQQLSCLEGRAKVNVVACIVATQNNFDTNFVNQSCVKFNLFQRMSNTNSPGQFIPPREGMRLGNQGEISTSPGGSKIVYERSFLINMRNCPLARTPPRNLPIIPLGLWNNNQAVSGAWGRNSECQP